MKVVLDRLIHNDQQAFIQSRYLGNSVLDLYSMGAHALEEDEDYLVLSLDIEKAFDSISWTFLYDLLLSYGFPAEFVAWLKVFHNGKELRIFNNGHSSAPIRVSNGLSQGCSLSPLCFIVCMESLAASVRNNDKIPGLQIGVKEKKIGLVADDTLLVFKRDVEVVREVEATLAAFEQVSGLKVNIISLSFVRLAVIMLIMVCIK